MGHHVRGDAVPAMPHASHPHPHPLCSAEWNVSCCDASDFTNPFGGTGSQLRLREHYLIQVPQGPSMLRMLLDCPMQKIAHERLFLAAQQASPRADCAFETYHTAAVGAYIDSIAQNLPFSQPDVTASHCRRPRGQGHAGLELDLDLDLNLEFDLINTFSLPEDDRGGELPCKVEYEDLVALWSAQGDDDEYPEEYVNYVPPRHVMRASIYRGAKIPRSVKFRIPVGSPSWTGRSGERDQADRIRIKSEDYDAAQKSVNGHGHHRRQHHHNRHGTKMLSRHRHRLSLEPESKSVTIPPSELEPELDRGEVGQRYTPDPR